MARMSKESFEAKYWPVTEDTPGGPEDVHPRTRREFYEDYRESGLSFAAYVAKTTCKIWER